MPLITYNQHVPMDHGSPMNHRSRQYGTWSEFVIEIRSGTSFKNELT